MYYIKTNRLILIMQKNQKNILHPKTIQKYQTIYLNKNNNLI